MKHVNLTHLLHTLWALLIQFVIGVSTGDWWAGAAAGAAFFVGREVRDAEYRYRALHKTTWEEMPEYAGLHPSVWRWPDDADGWLDWLVPTVAVFFVATAASVM